MKYLCEVLSKVSAGAVILLLGMALFVGSSDYTWATEAGEKCSDDTMTCPDPADKSSCLGTATTCQKGTCNCKQKLGSCPCVPK